MIPLRTPAPLLKFPVGLLLGVLISLVLTLLFASTVSSADSLGTRLAVSTLVFPSRALGVLCLWYLWIFFPARQHRAGARIVFDVLLVLACVGISLALLKLDIEAALSFVFTFVIFGAVMRDLIWENVDTLVFGPKIFSVFAVPCYVHVFFFLLYIFIAQLIHPAYGMPGKTIYLVSLISFLVGFLIRTLEFKGLKEE